MATNDFLTFGGDPAANVITQAQFAALVARLSGFQSGVAKSGEVNKVLRQASIMSAVLAQFIADKTGRDVLDDGTVATILASLKAAQVQGDGSVRGLTGLNNAAAPATQYDCTAQAVFTRNIVTGVVSASVAPGTITNNISLAGPALNGRDQAGAFPNGSWVYWYYVKNPSTGVIGSVTSSSGPAVGPTLTGALAGFTEWQLATTLRIDGAGSILRAYTRGARVMYDIASNSTTRVLNLGASAIMTTVSLATLVPPIASRAILNFYENVVSSLAVEYFSRYRPTGSSITGIIGTTVTIQSAGGVGMSSGATIELVPGTGQSIDYSMSPNTFSGGGLTLDVLGYTIPNGDA